MFTGSIQNHAQLALQFYHEELSKLLSDSSDLISYVGTIGQLSPNVLKDVIEENKNPNSNKLTVLIYSGGGLVEAAEKMVGIMRHHYDCVDFIIPEMAMSAATIMCMSGDEIHMDYSSSLGPIDPQVQNKEGHFVPALGYLDKVEEIIEKSKNNQCSSAELMLLSQQDLGTLRRYEQARDLSVNLLKKWLVQYKFKNWLTHSSTGANVTLQEKEQRAEEIANKFCDHNYWHSHSRYISMRELQDSNIRLLINDFGQTPAFSKAIHQYHDLLLDYSQVIGKSFYIHCKSHLQGM